MLGARGIPAHTLEENLAQLEKHISLFLLPEERDVVVDFLSKGREAFANPEKNLDAQDSGDGLGLTREVFLAAILGGQRQAALLSMIDEALRDGHSHLDLYVAVFAECLHRVGELCELNKISVAQEHIATSIVQYAIAAIYPRMVPPAVARGSMVVTGVAGERHQIGANLVADAMEAKGWMVRFLGTNLPHSSVLSAVEQSSADVLCISTTIVANLPAVAELVQSVRAKLNGQRPRIVVGGAAYRQAAHFAREVGSTDAVTNLRDGLALLCAEL